MADSFFGFDTSLSGGLDDAIDCPLDDDEIGEEEEYDALNDETFGAEASAGDWEQDHEKLAQITESTRPQGQPIHATNKNGIDVDIEESLSHLVLDEKDGIVPRPGVWDSPTNLPLGPLQPPPLSVALKHCPTLEEVERNLRPPPGLIKPTNLTPTNANQLPRNVPGQFIIDYPGINEHLNLRTNILNNLAPPRFPPGLGLAGPHPVIHQIQQNIRLPNAPPLLPNSRPIPGNQAANILRYPLPPHLMLAHSNQRPPIHPNFIGNFPPPPRPNLPPQFFRPDLPIMPPFNNNHVNQLHLHHHHQQQQQQHHHHHHQLQQQQHSGNQRIQNRPFHHNDQPSNHQPFFKNNQHWHQNRLNQRYHHHGHGMNGIGDNGEYDEYAGLMSTREKQWLTNIQLLQHNTNQPYFDDYYFTVFCDRQNKKNANQDHKDKKQHNKNGYHNRDSRDKDQQSQHVLTKVVYTPTQFENSLGKLQCGSVTAPRKIIDMDVVPNSDPQQNAPAQQKDMKKARQRLLEIERLYTIQLKLEDVNNPLALLAEQQALQQQQQSDQEPEVKPVKKTAPELIKMMLKSLQRLLKEDQLVGILSIRKGKTLLLRFLPYLSVTEYTSQLEEFWVALIRGLAILGRRDPHLLVRFFPEFHNWLETVRDFSVIIRFARSFSYLPRSSMDSGNFGNKLNSSLTFAVTNKFGVSVIASMLEQAENLYPKNKDETLIREWSAFIVNLADTIGASPPCAAPCHPIAANALQEHLQRIDGLTIERYAPLEALLTDANPSR